MYICVSFEEENHLSVVPAERSSLCECGFQKVVIKWGVLRGNPHKYFDSRAILHYRLWGSESDYSKGIMSFENFLYQFYRAKSL